MRGLVKARSAKIAPAPAAAATVLQSAAAASRTSFPCCAAGPALAAVRDRQTTGRATPHTVTHIARDEAVEVLDGAGDTNPLTCLPGYLRANRLATDKLRTVTGSSWHQTNRTSAARSLQAHLRLAASSQRPHTAEVGTQPEPLGLRLLLPQISSHRLREISIRLRLICADNLPQIFRIEACRKGGGADEIAEHHAERTAFGGGV